MNAARGPAALYVHTKLTRTHAHNLSIPSHTHAIAGKQSRVRCVLFVSRLPFVLSSGEHRETNVCIHARVSVCAMIALLVRQKKSIGTATP